MFAKAMLWPRFDELARRTLASTDEIVGALAGMMGAYLQSEGLPFYGFVAFAISNVGMISFASRKNAKWLLLMQVVFAATTVNGLINHFPGS